MCIRDSTDTWNRLAPNHAAAMPTTSATAPAAGLLSLIHILLAVAPEEAESLWDELQKASLPAQIVGEITEKQDAEIVVSYPE